MANEHLKEMILQVVENQINTLNPPETKETFDRLIETGYSEKDTRELIGRVVVSEIFDVVSQGRKFDHDKYVAALNKLPHF